MVRRIATFFFAVGVAAAVVLMTSACGGSPSESTGFPTSDDVQFGLYHQSKKRADKDPAQKDYRYVICDVLSEESGVRTYECDTYAREDGSHKAVLVETQLDGTWRELGQ